MMKFLTKHFEVKHEGVEMVEKTNFAIKIPNDVVVHSINEGEMTDEAFNEIIQNNMTDISHQHIEDGGQYGEAVDEASVNSYQTMEVEFSKDGEQHQSLPQTLMAGMSEQPMSEAITLAELSQQLNNPIPVFLLGNKSVQGQQVQQITIPASSVQQVQQIAPAPVASGDQLQHLSLSASSSAAPVSKQNTINASASPGKIKIQVIGKTSLAPSLSTGNTIILPTQKGSSPQIRVVRRIQNSGGMVQTMAPSIHQAPQMTQMSTSSKPQSIAVSHEHPYVTASAPAGQSIQTMVSNPSASVGQGISEIIAGLTSETARVVNEDGEEVTVTVMSADKIEGIFNSS